MWINPYSYCVKKKGNLFTHTQYSILFKGIEVYVIIAIPPKLLVSALNAGYQVGKANLNNCGLSAWRE